MSESSSNTGRGGCLMLLVLAVVGLFVLASMSPSKTKATPTGSDTNQTLSGNEALSRNTTTGFNFGDITNMFYDCIGANACTFDSSTDTQVDSSTTDESVTTTTTEVSGERNTLTTSSGETACQDPNDPNVYSPYFCPGQPGAP
jgi:hypothetical protein